MSDQLANLFRAYDTGGLSRRQLLTALGLAGVAVTRPISALAQGSCGGANKGTPQCDPTPFKAPFEATGWKTVWLDYFTMEAADYQKEAAFYAALVNWTLRSDDGKKALMDAGTAGGMLIRGGYQPPPPPPAPAATATPPANAAGATAAGGGAAGAGRGGGRGGGGRGPSMVACDGFCWGIEPWNAKKVEAELTKRGLKPVADHDSKTGFESFHVLDPGGFDLQISNSNPKKNLRSKPATAKLSVPALFEPTDLKTVWLDHISFQCPDYKASVAFYQALLGWKPTGDEGSQNECEIGDIGNALIRGTNMSPAAVEARVVNPGRGGRGGNKASIDHIAFGLVPWDPEAVQAELQKRSLVNTIDTGGKGNDMASLKKSPYQSFHTRTPNGFTLQISKTTRDTRNVR